MDILKLSIWEYFANVDVADHSLQKELSLVLTSVGRFILRHYFKLYIWHILGFYIAFYVCGRPISLGF